MSNSHPEIGVRTQIASTVQFVGDVSDIVVGDDVRIAHGVVIYAGTRIGSGTSIDESAVIGKPESGYAMGAVRDSESRSGAHLGRDVRIRGGAYLYDGVSLGDGVAIGHSTLLRSNVSIGEQSQLAHFISVERGAKLGAYVRSSPHTHLTGEVIVEDRVFFGAGVKTINDSSMHWRTGKPAILKPPTFRQGCAIGSGSTISSGVTIGKWAMVGAHSLVTSDVSEFEVAYGVPARTRGLRDLTGLTLDEAPRGDQVE